MKVRYTQSFLKQYKKLPQQIQESFDKKLKFLLKNLYHPSLRVKKIKGTEGKIWEGSISLNYRFTFQIIEDIILLRRVGTHDTLKNP